MATRFVLLFLAGLLAFADEPIVFRSDVALARVDAQVVDRNNRAITGLQVEDFVLFEGGQKRDIRNFEAEDMPVDVLLLLDVSGSMQSHIERLSAASRGALQVLGPDDRVGIMVFDRSSRLRLPFKNNRETVIRELENVLNHETFDGGTDINRGLLDAAHYVEREGRKNARKAIVILTDDQTERGRDEDGVMRALTRADAVLSALIAPDAMRGRYGRGGGGGYPRGGGYPSGGGWPSGGGMGGPLGGIILGRRGPYGGGYPGGGYPSGGGGPVIIGGNTTSAGTEEIARRSGGDSMRVDDAAALEQTLMRIRQRYALHFNVADGASAKERDIEVQLAEAAKRRYPGSEVRYRRAHIASDGPRSQDPVMVSKTPTRPASGSSSNDQQSSPGLRRRRAPVNEDGTRIDPDPQQAAGGGWRRADEPSPEPSPVATAESVLTPSASADKAPEQQPQQGGWRRIKPGEQP